MKGTSSHDTGSPGSRNGSLTADGHDHLWMIVFVVIIAGSFRVVATITPGIDSAVLTFWRFLTATAFFGLMLPFVKDRRLPGLRDLARYGVVGGSYALFFILMFESLKITSPLNTSTIHTTLPLLTMLMGGLIGEPMRFRQMGILALSMAATLWVIFRGNWARMVGMEFSHGDLLLLSGTGFLAVHMLAMKRLQRDESKVCFTFYSLLTATAALLIVAICRVGTLPFPDAPVWVGIGYLAGPSTAGTFWILQKTTPRLGPNRVVAYTFLTPSVVAAIEWSFGFSTPEWSVLPGIALTLAAVWLLQLNAVSGDR